MSGFGYRGNDKNGPGGAITPRSHDHHKEITQVAATNTLSQTESPPTEQTHKLVASTALALDETRQVVIRAMRYSDAAGLPRVHEHATKAVAEIDSALAELAGGERS